MQRMSLGSAEAPRDGVAWDGGDLARLRHHRDGRPRSRGRNTIDVLHNMVTLPLPPRTDNATGLWKAAVKGTGGAGGMGTGICVCTAMEQWVGISMLEVAWRG
jgi:hypothetical protein